MTTMHIVRQAQQRAPEWITLQQRRRGYAVTSLPLRDGQGSTSGRLGLRAVSNEALIRSLARDILQQPTTFQLKWNGQQTVVTTTPLAGARAVHVRAGDVTGIIALGQDDDEPTTYAMGAVAAIVLIVVVVAVAVTVITVVEILTDEGSGEVEVHGEGEGDGEGDGEGGEGGDQGGA